MSNTVLGSGEIEINKKKRSLFHETYLLIKGDGKQTEISHWSVVVNYIIKIKYVNWDKKWMIKILHF